jgi:hypothetical protein
MMDEKLLSASLNTMKEWASTIDIREADEVLKTLFYAWERTTAHVVVESEKTHKSI